MEQTREILFRGKRTDTGAWVQGSYISRQHFREAHQILCELLSCEEGHYNTYFCDIVPSTLGQFTGLIDKNGNKVFEGDIILSTGLPLKVVFIDGEFVGIDENSVIYRLNRNAGAVIGNSHDNPELLEV